eukprot:scaffold287_cov337-Pavlova_lutheri.AAC.119
MASALRGLVARRLSTAARSWNRASTQGTKRSTGTDRRGPTATELSMCARPKRAIREARNADCQRFGTSNV